MSVRTTKISSILALIQGIAEQIKTYRHWRQPTFATNLKKDNVSVYMEYEYAMERVKTKSRKSQIYLTPPPIFTVYPIATTALYCQIYQIMVVSATGPEGNR
jgi:hypothetical protein